LGAQSKGDEQFMLNRVDGSPAYQSYHITAKFENEEGKTVTIEKDGFAQNKELALDVIKFEISRGRDKGYKLVETKVKEV
jgi:hypothetical protein